MSIIDRSAISPVIFNFSSKDRISGTNSNFYNEPLDLGINKYDSVCLVQSSIPRSFYNVPSSYNTFILSENGVNKTVTIPAGSYNRVNFQTVLQSRINSVSTYTYTVSYPNTASQGDTFKYTFSVNNSNPVSFIFTNSLFRQMGFEQNSTNVFIGQSLTSTNCINLAYITRAYIKSNVCIAEDSILEEILNYGSFPMLSLAYYQQISFDLNSRVFNPNSQNSWNFVLVDSFDQEIDLNGIPWSFSLIFFQRNNISELSKKDIELRNEERLLNIEKEKENLISKISDISTISENMNTDNLNPIFPVIAYTNSVLSPIPFKEDKKDKK